MRTGHRPTITLCLIAWAGLVSAQAPSSPPTAEVRARVETFVAALSSTPQAFEAMAREHCTPGFLERRSADERAQMLTRLRGDFGVMRVESMRSTDEGVEVEVSGSTGMHGRLMLALEPDPTRRIDRMGIAVEAGGSRRDAPDRPNVPISSAMDEATLSQALDGYLTGLSSRDEFSGVVLVHRGGRTVFNKAYGEADRDAHLPNTPTTRFNIGSINKSFTTVAITRLIGEGKVKRSDTIGNLLPDYPNADARTATVQQLLDHQGGIADFFGPAYAATPKNSLRSNRDYYQLVAPQPLTFAPGTSRRYCNGCYIVLGEIVARVTGQSYEDYVAQHVFRPAGMTTAGFLRTETKGAQVAQGYTRRSGAGDDLRPNTGMHGHGGSAAGGAYASAADLLAFVQALQGNRLLTREQTASIGGGRLGIAGGAPGLNASVEADEEVVVIVLANLDPPHAEQLAAGIARQLRR